VAPAIAATSAWRTLRELISTVPSIYLSDPLLESSDTLSAETVQRARPDAVEDTDTLHYLLRYSDVLINFFSTISLEALVCDLPVIHIAYDEYTSGLRAGHLLKFRMRHDLNRKKLRHESTRIAKSPKELVRFIDTYLEDRSLDQEKRKEYALFECEYLDGKASERFASALEALIRRESIKPSQ
jgi:CDP-glycerol glycerophosphotransferase (TagB/SpsB family)